MGRLAGIALALALIAYVGFVGGAIEFFFPAAPLASASPSSPDAALPFSFPLPYAATITQSGDGIDEPRTRFYFTRAAKEAQ